MEVTILLPLCLLVAPSLGYKMFQDLIPNGESVPHPCKPNSTWQGVGHLVPGGGVARNPFGLDFDSSGKKWDRCLCEKDSDGDGRTNGEELGDPGCLWTPGTVPHRTMGLTHPGVCEPLDDPLCQANNKNLGDLCTGSEEVNPCIMDIMDKPDVMTWEVRHPRTPVPPQETTYMCQTFSVPDVSTDYHVIAREPFIDNAYVLHHMIVFGCDDTATPVPDARPCGMTDEGCRKIIGLWTVGDNGDCTKDQFGYRIGKSGFKMVLLQTHWNNPDKRADWTDSSGIWLYYTPVLRPYNGGTSP